METSNNAEALEILDRMSRMVRAGRMERGVYVEGMDWEQKRQALDLDEDLEPLCNGWKFCAIGSLMLAGKVTPTMHYRKGGDYSGAPLSEVYSFSRETQLIGEGIYVRFTIMGSDENERRDMWDSGEYEGLRLAYDALNKAADEFIERHEIPANHLASFAPRIEQLFEGEVQFTDEDGDECARPVLDEDDLYGVVMRAAEIVQAGVPA